MSGRILSRFGYADLALDAMDQDFNFNNACRLLTVYIHFTAPVTEEITITYKSDHSTLYNTVIATRIMDTEQDYVYSASGLVALNETEYINISITNANGVGSAYVTCKCETDF